MEILLPLISALAGGSSSNDSQTLTASLNTNTLTIAISDGIQLRWTYLQLVQDLELTVKP